MDSYMQSLLAAMAGARARRQARPAFYRRLAAGQRPSVVVICCSDSRAGPELIAGADPGMLFVVRTIAGLIPPPPGPVERVWLCGYRAATRLVGLRALGGAWYATWAAIEYPVMHLGVPNILVLGHSGCGGIALACQPRGSEPTLHDTDCWVDMVRPALTPVLRRQPHGQGARIAEEAAVLWSLGNLMKHRSIAAKVNAGETAVHAARYDIASGEIALFDPRAQAFVALSAAQL